MDTEQHIEIPGHLIEALDTLADQILATEAFLRVRSSAARSVRGMTLEAPEDPRAQEEATALLRGVNLEISSLIGMDFARLAGRSTC